MLLLFLLRLEAVWEANPGLSGKKLAKSSAGQVRQEPSLKYLGSGQEIE